MEMCERLCVAICSMLYELSGHVCDLLTKYIIETNTNEGWMWKEGRKDMKRDSTPRLI